MLVFSVTRAMSLSASAGGGGPSSSVAMSSSASSEATTARSVRVVCLSASLSPRCSGRSRHPAHRRLQHAAGGRRRVDAAQQIAAPDVEVVLELDRDRVGRHRGVQRAVERLHGGDRGARPARQRHDLLPGAQRPARDLAGVAARAPRRRPRAAGPTGSAAAPARPRGRRPRRPARDARAAAARRTTSARAALDDVVAVQGRDRERARRRRRRSAWPARRTPARSRGSGASSQSTRSILLTAATRWRMPSSADSAAWRRDCSTIPLPGVDQDHRQVRGRGARDHVARVALVARACRR